MRNILVGEPSNVNGKEGESGGGSLDVGVASLTSSLPALENLPDDANSVVESQDIERIASEEGFSVTVESSGGLDGDNQSSEGLSSRKTSTVSTAEFTSPEYTPENTLHASQLEQLPGQVEVPKTTELRKTSELGEVVVVPTVDGNVVADKPNASETQNLSNPEVSTPKTTPVRKLSRFLVSPVVLPSTDPNSTLIQVQEGVSEPVPEQPKQRVSKTENALNEVLVVENQQQPAWTDTGQLQAHYQNQQQGNHIKPEVLTNQLGQMPANEMGMAVEYSAQQDMLDANAQFQLQQQQQQQQQQQIFQQQQQQQQRLPQVMQTSVPHTALSSGAPSLTGILSGVDTQAASRMPETLEQLKIELENITHAHVSTKVAKEQSALSAPNDQGPLSISSPGIMETQPIFTSPVIQHQQPQQPHQQLQSTQIQQQQPQFQPQLMQMQQMQSQVQYQQPIYQMQPNQQQYYVQQPMTDYSNMAMDPQFYHQQQQQQQQHQMQQNSVQMQYQTNNVPMQIEPHQPLPIPYTEEPIYMHPEFTPARQSMPVESILEQPRPVVAQENLNDGSGSLTAAATSRNTSLYNSRRTSADLNNADPVSSHVGSGGHSANIGTPAGSVMVTSMEGEKWSQTSSVDKADR
jgi:hypothetical protein